MLYLSFRELDLDHFCNEEELWEKVLFLYCGCDYILDNFDAKTCPWSLQEIDDERLERSMQKVTRCGLAIFFVK